MGEFLARYLSSSHQHGLFGNYTERKWKGRLNQKQEWQQCGEPEAKTKQSFGVKNQMAMKPVTYSARISTDIPLYESPGASFDRYLEDKPSIPGHIS